MSETKPPEENYPDNWPKGPPPGFVDWIDAVLQPDRKHEGGWMYARRDAAQLRAKAAAYDEAMRLISDEEFWPSDVNKAIKLDDFIAAEIAAKRFTP